MRILLADDHQLLRDTIASFMAGEGIDVLPAGSLPEAVSHAASNHDLDLILLDIDMPGMNGLEGLSKMRSACPNIPVVILSGNTDADIVLSALKRGAQGFIPKSAGSRSFLNAVRLVLSGDRYIPNLLVEQIEYKLSQEQKVSETPLEQTFSLLEKKILKLLKQGFSNKQIARELNIEDYTVKHHLRRVFKMLDAANRTQAVRVAIERNLP